MELVEDNKSKEVFNKLLIMSIIFFLLSIGLAFASILNSPVKIILPIILTACFILPRIILIIIGSRSAIDIWAVFTYTSMFVFLYSPIYHLVTGDTISINLPTDFHNLFQFVAWSSIPIVPLFYIGGFIRTKIKINIQRFDNIEISTINLKGISIFYIIIGLLSNFLINRFSILNSLIGTFYMLKDFFSVGLLLLYYDWAFHKKDKGRFLSVILLLFIITLITLFNLDRGSRFFILIYSFWGLYIYSTMINKKIKVGRLLLVSFILIPLLTQYKLFKYAEYDLKYFYDNQFRKSISEKYEQLTPSYTIATDLGRYYIWMLYYKELKNGGNIDFQYGKTYFDALQTMMPSFIVKNKPPGMIALSHDAESGRGYYEYYKPKSAKIGGIWAESYVNFGLVGIWLVSILFGYTLQLIHEMINRQKFGSISVIIGGLLVTFGAEVLLHDLRLILWHISKHFITILPLFVFFQLRKGKVE